MSICHAPTLPVLREEFLFYLKKAYELAGQPAAAEMTFRDTPGHAPTVLVADDSEFFRGQIQRLVEAAVRFLP